MHTLSWAHSLAGLESPGLNPLVQATLEGLKRMLAKPVVKKAPVTAEILKAIVDDAMRNPTLSKIRLVSACLLAYAGFLRADELIKLRSCDISMDGGNMVVRIASSKTDQLWQGDEVLIVRTRSPTCPVAMLERHIQVAQIPPGSEEFLYRPISRVKHGEKLRASGQLSYSTLRELFKRKLAELGYPAVEFGLHS